MIHITEKENLTFIQIDNQTGMQITLCDFGASVYDVKVKDKNGKSENVVLTPSDISDFCHCDGYFGKCVGRFSGRIDNAKCQINGITYQLEKNWNQINALHGESNGISFQKFAYEVKENDNSYEIIFNYLEKEGHLPGDVNYKITYEVFKNENEYVIYLNAISNKDTLVNLTNHTYFNLTGDLKNTVLQEKLQLNCNTYTRLNENDIAISIDKVNPVMDFTNMHEIGKYIDDSSLQDHIQKGYDHCFIKEDSSNSQIAILKDDETGRKLTVYTDYPAIVCYALCYPPEFPFNSNQVHVRKHHGIALECQYIPNGINMEHVNKGILKKDELYSHYIRYHFDIEK